MTVPGNIDALLLGGQRGYQIERSLRFNSADSAYLNRTPGSTGNRKTWTWSLWLKRTTLGTQSMVWSCGGNNVGGDSDYLECFFNSSNKLGIGTLNGVRLVSTQVFRDPSAWLHLIVKLDTTQATVSNRLVVYVNNSEITAWDTDSRSTYFTQNSDQGVNRTEPHLIGRQSYSGSDNSNHYLAEVQFIDGQALTPSSFGETDTITGVWKPKRYSGTYGTNGFYLKFADNSGTTSTTLGKDSSPNGNNFTPNNFSVTAGAGNDSLIDVPTPYADGGNGRGNYCTWNPLNKDTTTLSNGNLNATMPGRSAGTFAVSSGKWYWECTYNAGNGYALGIGIANVNAYYPAEGFSFGVIYYGADGSKYVLGTNSSYSTSYSGGTFGIALDLNSAQNTIEFFIDGTSKGVINISSGITWTPLVQGGSGSTTGSWDANFGQRPFAYTPPSGFVALNTQNLPEPSIKKPSSYFESVIYTGNATARSITGLNFSPNFVFASARNSNESHRIYDSVRGATISLFSNNTNAESTESQSLTAFNSDGFSLGTGAPNTNSVSYVAWCWDESATPGFDIVTYTGDGVAGRTVSHSLGVAPSMIIVKSRNNAVGWPVYHASFGNTGAGFLHSTLAWDYPTAAYWNNTSPTSSVFSLGTTNLVNANTYTYVAYLWSEVAGFSKFGSYTGNGSSDGPFVFCGFRPRLIWIKRTDTTGEWFAFDTARDTFNVSYKWTKPNNDGTEPTTAGNDDWDLLSNGFKPRNSNGNQNASGGTCIFCAWAETPFRTALAR